MAWYDEPKYNRTLSSAGYLLFCLLYVVASVLPFLMLAFAAGVALGLFSGRVLLVMARADKAPRRLRRVRKGYAYQPS